MKRILDETENLMKLKIAVEQESIPNQQHKNKWNSLQANYKGFTGMFLVRMYNGCALLGIVTNTKYCKKKNNGHISFPEECNNFTGQCILHFLMF